MTQYINIIPKDTVIARDGRPFSNGGRIKSLNWFYPSVIAGTIRTMIGVQNKFEFNEQDVINLKNTIVNGPLPSYKNSLYFPRPLDCVAKSKIDYFRVKPQKPEQDEWTDIPDGLLPTIINSDEDFKPYNKMPAFWKQDVMVDWLCEEDQKMNFVPFNTESCDNSDNFMSFPNKDIRTHVQIEKETQISKDGQLFQTTGLDFTNNTFSDSILMSVKVEGNYKIEKSLATMGGERRTVFVDPNSNINWNCPDKISQKLNNSKFVRMVLATPAIFKSGWKPGWLDENLEGSPIPNIKLKLQSAIIDRWTPVSGWSLENNKPRCKPVRRMVPAGSVYFFEVIEGNAQELSKLWLNSVCDYEQDKKDGFGLAIFGIYK